MSLKCHLCGKEYYHDGKLCQTCEKTANNSLLPHSGLDTKKWRCDNFLELKGLPFGCNLDWEVEFGTKAEGITHRDKLENNEYDLNLFTTIRFDKTEMNETKINHFLRYE